VRPLHGEAKVRDWSMSLTDAKRYIFKAEEDATATQSCGVLARQTALTMAEQHALMAMGTLGEFVAWCREQRG